MEGSKEIIMDRRLSLTIFNINKPGIYELSTLQRPGKESLKQRKDIPMVSFCAESGTVDVF